MNEYAVDFDQLLHNYEYDNQQYIISIEKENQLIKDFSRDIEMTKLSIMKLQESISEMDESTKRVHKQFIMNRDNCVSLKKTSTLLTEHFATLTKKLETFICKHKQETSENQKMLDHYWNIWKDYDAKYHTFTFVQVLENKMKEFSLTENLLKDKKQKKQKMVANFADLQGCRQLTYQELQKLFIDLSKLKLNSIRKQENISSLETKIKQKNKEKQEVNSPHEEPESNKENFPADVYLAPEESQVSERMDYQCQDKVSNDYEPLQKLPSFESNTNVSLQLGNSTIPCGKNVSITKTCEKTVQSFHHGNLFKQPDVNFAKNQRNIALNTKLISHPPVRINNPIVPEDIIMSTKLSVSETTNTLPKAPAELPERTNIVMPSLHVPLIQNIMPNQASPGNCNQLRKHDSDAKITTVPSVSVAVQNSCANVQVTQPLYHPPKQIQASLTSPYFPSGTLQTSLPASKCNSSPITTSSKQATLSRPQEITHISSVNNEGTFNTVVLDDTQKLFDFNEHQKFMRKFHSSPGAPSLTQRPMFEHKDVMVNVEKVNEKKRVENPFFLQSFFTEQDELKETPGSVTSPPRDFLSNFSGFNQNSENEITTSQLDLGFNNSFGGSSTSETNFFSFGNDSGFTQAEESTSDFNFNFNAPTNSDTDNNTGFSLF